MPRRPAKLPPGVRRRPGRPYEVFYPGPDGRRVQETVGHDLREAVRYREERIEEVRAGTWVRADAGRRDALTLGAWASTWLDRRGGRDNPPRTLADDAARLRDHVLPALGEVRIEGLTVDHVRALISSLRSKVSPTTGKALSPNTVHNVYGTFAKCLRDAAKELGRAGVAWTPPVDLLDDGEAPMRVERPRGAYSRAELESLISDPRIPEDRRTFWALLGLTGMRHDEAAGLRWRDVDFRAEPLPRIELTKQAGDRPLKEDKRGTGKRREVPMHPTLREVLDAWRSGGFVRLYGRHPRPDDYLVPSVSDVRDYRVSRTTHKQIQRDCLTLRSRPRTVHELRNTFVQLASLDAPELEAVVATITHSVKPVAGAFNTYRGSRWVAACAVMERLDVRAVRHAEVVVLPRAQNGEAPVSVTLSVTSETGASKPLSFQTLTAERTGLEVAEKPAISGHSGHLRTVGPELGHPRFTGETTHVARVVTKARATVLADVAPFIGLAAGVDEESTLRVLGVVARDLGLSERELAAKLSGQS